MHSNDNAFIEADSMTRHSRSSDVMTDIPRRTALTTLARTALAAAGTPVAASLGVALAGGSRMAHAQAVDGKEFRSVAPAAPTDAPAGRIEVVEFFWYGCPHCHSLEPALKEWARRLPADVVFRKAHVPWQVQAHQQLFFTLESLNLADAHNDKVFAAIHNDRNKLDKPEAMADLLARHGVDRKQFLDAYASFGVRTRAQRATQLAAAYKIDGVPTFGVAGRFVTSPSMTGSNGAALQMVDALVARARKGG
jgi:thiol:disulfide interchange protein DsbA